MISMVSIEIEVKCQPVHQDQIGIFHFASFNNLILLVEE